MTLADQLAQLDHNDLQEFVLELWSQADSDAERAAVIEALGAAWGTPLGLYQLDPVGYISTVQGGWLSKAQQRVADAVVAHKRTAVPAGHDLGKSWLAARMVTWWGECHPPGSVQIITTAPTFAQVKAILWKEIARSHVEGACRGRLNLTEWWAPNHLGVDERMAVGRKPADNSPGAFQGVHERYVLVVIDEADEVHPNIWEAIDTVVTNEHSRVLAIGNPVHPTSEFAKVCYKAGAPPDWSSDLSDQGWWVERLDGLDSPNFTGEPMPPGLSELLLSPGWVDDYAKRHGANSQAFNSRVRGVHPTESADSVVPLGWLLDRCRHFVEHPDQGLLPVPAAELWQAAELTPVDLGLDVGAGGDRTVLTARTGRRALTWWETRSRDPQVSLDLVLDAAAELTSQGHTLAELKVDVVGWGWGLYGSLVEKQSQGLLAVQRVVPVHVGMSSTDPARYRRLRDQIWWEVGRELTEQGVWDFTDIPREQLMQLAEPRYWTDAAGRICIEQKSETRARIKASPDHADSWLLCYLTLPASYDGYLVIENHQQIGA